MSPEQLLIIAREFCKHHRVRIVRFDALVAGAAATGAKIDGIPVHAGPSAAARALARTLEVLEPLSGRNKEFAKVCAEIYLSVTDGV